MIEHDRRYYDENRPLISDYEYDQKMKALIAYEKAHPDDIHPNSPAQRVAEAPTEGFIQKEHLFPMLSLANTYSEEEVEDFIKRVYKLVEKKGISFCAELKMDGTAISLRYKKGRLFQAVTRGNGRIGDDVTQNIKTIKSIPLTIDDPKFPEDIEIRGEVYLTLKTFKELNQERQEAGLETFANPRNAAAGSLKLLDSKEVAKRRLHIVCYGAAAAKPIASKQREVHTLLKKWGFPTAQEEHLAVADDLQGIMKFASKIESIRDELAFEIDGIVVKVDEISLHSLLGFTGKSPRFAIAYKFAPEQASTQILGITVQVGRSGVLTPVAELEPVLLAGSVISRATLHNQEEVARKDIRIGDTVVIEKGGDVIPKVVSVDIKKRSSHAKSWHMPKHCPICHTAVIHPVGEVAVRCPNPKCGGQKVKKILFFTSKHAMDIDHMGEKIVEQLVEKGLVSAPSDIYLLEEKDLARLEGFKEKSIHNLLTSIERSKKCTLSRFIMGLQIKYVGAETAELLADEAGSIEALMSMTVADLTEIEGVGEKTAVAIAEYFKDRDQIKEIDRLLSLGVTPIVKKGKIRGHAFEGKSFVLTGTLSSYSREEASTLIKERGGKVSGSVSAKTDYLLLGEEPGSKYEKAKKLGVKIVSEEEFKKMLDE